MGIGYALPDRLLRLHLSMFRLLETWPYKRRFCRTGIAAQKLCHSQRQILSSPLKQEIRISIHKKEDVDGFPDIF